MISSLISASTMVFCPDTKEANGKVAACRLKPRRVFNGSVICLSGSCGDSEYTQVSLQSALQLWENSLSTHHSGFKINTSLMTNTDATISAYPTSLTAGSFTVIILQTCSHAKSLLN